MVDVSKRFSGSPKVQPKPNLGKKWMSEPNLLVSSYPVSVGRTREKLQRLKCLRVFAKAEDDEDETWIKEQDNMEEDGVSFAEEVPELSLVHINKQRVQLRPKRRPPSRDHVKSRASMDFDIFMPEVIKEEDEDFEQSTTTEDEDIKQEQSPVRPTPPPKPAGSNGWRLPTPTTEVVLRPTKPAKTDEIKEPEIEDNINDIHPETSPEKKQRERKRFKIHLFKFRRSRKGRQNGKANNIEPKTNLTNACAISVDSGKRPLGDDSRQRRRNRRSRRSDEKGLNWILGFFHKRNTPTDTEVSTNVADDEPTGHTTGNQGDSNAPELRVEEWTNGHTSHDQEEANQNTESVSDLKRKFERLSAAF